MSGLRSNIYFILTDDFIHVELKSWTDRTASVCSPLNSDHEKVFAGKEGLAMVLDSVLEESEAIIFWRAVSR